MALTQNAKSTLRAAGISQAARARRFFTDGQWHGDDCGCADDRCIGYHHDDLDECSCLPSLIDAFTTEKRAEAAGAIVWRDYQHARATGDEELVDRARQNAAAWVKQFYGPGLLSWSLDEIVDGKAGISLTNQWNDQRHLVWHAR